MSIISEKEVHSFEEKLYNLEEGINRFDSKAAKCNLSGIIDLSHKIETDIEILNRTLSGFVKFESKAVDEIRNKRLEIHLSKLKTQYNIWKTSLDDCECNRR